MTDDDGFRLVAVCAGNVHRSALAGALLRRWADWYLPPQLAGSVSVDSAGLSAPVGRPMDERVLRLARALGADGSAHRAAQLDDALLADADLVLVASRRQREEVLHRAPALLRKTFTMREAGRIAEGLDADVNAPATPATVAEMRRVVERLAERRSSPTPGADDITDPQGQGEEAYQRMAREEIPALAHTARILFGMPRADLDAYLEAATHPEDLFQPLPSERSAG